MAEPLYILLVVGLVPLPRKMPPDPFPAEDLQRLFADLRETANYRQFQFMPGGAGAQIFTTGEDRLQVQPALIQVRRHIESTPERAREVLMSILRATEKRLQLHDYVQCGIKVVAHVAPPDTMSAKTFVAERLLHRGDDAMAELGPTFFAGGVKFQNVEQTRREMFEIEPLIADDSYLFVDYDVQRASGFNGLELVSGVG